MTVIGWKLDRAQRAELLERFPPAWPDVIADHVTLRAGVSSAEPLPPPVDAEIVGSVDDGAGLQALAIAIDGSSDRPDSSIYHITWSLDRKAGRQAVQSNDVLAKLGWVPLDAPIPIRIVPARFD